MTLTGDNGLLTRTTSAKAKTEQAGIMENIRLAYQNALISKYLNEDEIADQIEKDLKGIYGQNSGVEVTESAGIYTVTTPDGTYIIGENGNISKKKGITVDKEILLQIVDGQKPEAVTINPTFEGLDNETKEWKLEGAEADKQKVVFTEISATQAKIEVADNVTEGTTGELKIIIKAGQEESEEIKVRVKVATSIKTFDSLVIEGQETANKTITRENETQKVTLVATLNNSESTVATEELVWSVNEEYRETVEIGQTVMEGKTQKVEVEIGTEAAGGDIVITAKTQEKEGRNVLSKTATITVNIPVSGIKMKKTEETEYLIDSANPPANLPEIKIAPTNGTVNLTAVINPSTASNKEVNWTISPASGVAGLSATTGSEITVTADASGGTGTATVTATSAADSSKNVSVTINVEAQTISYITWTAGYTEVESAEKPEGWSDYANGKWGNIKTTKNGITSYWVWIPRFAYVENDLTKPTAEKIDVKFVEKTVTNTNVGTSIGSGWKVHPAFTFGSDELEGFWVAKYEASAYNHTTDSYGGGNYTSYKAQSIPGVPSWRNISAQNIFKVCQAMKDNGGALQGIAGDSHMMKNSEWGAVAILSQSKYGVYNPTSLTLSAPKVWINPNNGYRTGNVGESADASSTTSTTSYDSANGPNASTTGTVYGVYDMAGGAWEYVAGCYSSTGTEFGTSINAKYYDTYNSSEQKKVLAITAWNKDYSYVVSSSYPVLLRGGNCGSGEGAGVFASSGVDGSAGYYCSFRPVWVAP